MAEDPGRRRLIRSAVEAARRRRTPFYLFDRRATLAAVRRWKAAAGTSAEIFYPWKCNRHPALIGLLASEGLGAEVTVGWDLEKVLERRDLGPDRALLQGPAKESRAIDLALASGARLVADSVEDTRAILARSRALGASPDYLLRFRPAAAEDSQSRYGLRPREAFALCRELARRGATPPLGLAFHLGTGIPSPAPYVAAIREAGMLSASLAGLGLEVETLDVGGGFASAGERRLDARGRPRGPAATPERFLSEIRSALERSFPGARLLLEPGRAIASDAFHLVTRVVRVGARRVYVDASRLAHAFFVPRGRHVFVPVPRRAGGPPVEIAGPLPVDLDVLTARAAVGRPREGDLIVVASVGAYNLMAANEWAGPKPEVVEAGKPSSSARGRPSGSTDSTVALISVVGEALVLELGGEARLADADAAARGVRAGEAGQQRLVVEHRALGALAEAVDLVEGRGILAGDLVALLHAGLGASRTWPGRASPDAPCTSHRSSSARPSG